MTNSPDWADLEAAGLHIPEEYQPRVALALRMAAVKFRAEGMRAAANMVDAMVLHEAATEMWINTGSTDDVAEAVCEVAACELRARADEIEKGK